MNEASCMKLDDREYITGYIADDIKFYLAKSTDFQLLSSRDSRITVR